jgi:SAM-dependent methyltransferase
MGTTNEYIFERNQQEHLRLRLIEEALDPATMAHLEWTGVRAGWRCLELGAGAGSILQWLASVVGESGSVVAVDKNISHIQNGSSPHVQVMEGDFLEVPLNGSFDLAHCRYVLIHNRAGDDMLQKLATLLRPGGFLVAEEPDFTSAMLLNTQRDVSQQRVNNAICRMFQEMLLDPAYGLSLPEKTAAAGLQVLHVDARIHLACGGSPVARMMGESTSALADKYVATGKASPSDIERYIANAGNHRFWAVYYVTVSVAAKKR